MSQLSSAQQRDISAYWANINFVAAQVTANFSLDQIQAAVAALDNAFDTTINAAATAGFGADTIIQGLNAVIPSPFSGATAQQKTLLCCYVLMKRAGVI